MQIDGFDFLIGTSGRWKPAGYNWLVILNDTEAAHAWVELNGVKKHRDKAKS